MLDAENGYWFHSHPRTKGTTGYPDAIFDKAWVKNDRYLGIAFKPGMGQTTCPMTRMCEWRCFDAIDTMNNLYANTGLRPKYLIADVDTYRKGPEDDIYPGHPINYVKLDRLPGPTDDWSADPAVDSQRRLLGHHRRDSDQELRGRRHGREADGIGRSRVDVSA